MENKKFDLVVLGGGPGGYTAAFRAADLGRSVTIIEKENSLGGVCLNVGCIPSKTLLHLSESLSDIEELKNIGISFSDVKLDFDKIRNHKNQVVQKLSSGLLQMCKARKVEILKGLATFIDDNQLKIKTEKEEFSATFNDLIIAAGSRSTLLPVFDTDDKRVWDSTIALDLKEIPKRLTVIGAGIIGLEMASIYSAFGSEITVVELAESILPFVDRDLRQPLFKEIKKRYKAIYTSTKVTKLVLSKDKLTLYLEGEKVPEFIETDAVLVAVGRTPNTDILNLENTTIKVEPHNFITTNSRMETSVKNIYAIGDITGNPMLAHKAIAQAKIASEAACKLKSEFTPLSIPSVAYTKPEIAWVGLTENEAQQKNIEYKKGTFPWQASGRALSSLAEQGLTKLLFDNTNKRLIGAGIVGKNAGEMIGETTLALEMGSDAYDIALTIHPHPTLSETIVAASELSEKIATDLINK